MTIVTDSEAVAALADAMWQLLDDMGDGTSVCLAAKAEARVAYEPFRDPFDSLPGWMPLEEARRFLADLG